MDGVLKKLSNSLVNCVGNMCNLEELPILSDNAIKYLYLSTITPGTDIMNKGLRHGTRTVIHTGASKKSCIESGVDCDSAISELTSNGYTVRQAGNLKRGGRARARTTRKRY